MNTEQIITAIKTLPELELQEVMQEVNRHLVREKMTHLKKGDQDELDDLKAELDEAENQIDKLEKDKNELESKIEKAKDALE